MLCLCPLDVHESYITSTGTHAVSIATLPNGSRLLLLVAT